MKIGHIISIIVAGAITFGCDSLTDKGTSGDQTGMEDGNGAPEEGDGNEDGGEDTPPSSGLLPGWFELPEILDRDNDGIDDNDGSLYYAYHLCNGNEKDDKGRTARNYTVCYSAGHHCPVWVAAPRHDMYEGSAKRTNAYGPDPDIPSEVQLKSKNAGSSCNKGHMLGSAERTSSSGTNRQVFYYTNIAPQLSDTFNTGGGAWNNLEILKPEDYVLGEFIVETSTNLHVPDLPGRPVGAETYDIDTLSYMAIPEEGILVSTADGTEIFETIDDLIDFLNTTTEDNINIYLSGLWSISESMSLNSDKQIKIHGNVLKPAIISGLTISQETIDNISIDKYVTIK